MKPHPPGVSSLRDSYYEHALDGLACCQMVVDARGQPIDFIYIQVNHNFEKMTGLKNVIGKRVTEVIPDIRSSNPELFDLYGQVAANGRPLGFETHVSALHRWFNVSVYSPKKGYFVAIFQDISLQKEIEENLENSRIAARNVLEDLSVEKSKVEASKAKDEAMLSSIGDGVIIVDPAGTITFINKSAQKMLGRTSVDVLNKSLFDVLPVEDENGVLVPAQERPMTAALTTGVTTTSTTSGGKHHVTETRIAPGKFFYVRRDKSKFPVSITIAPVFLEKKIVGAIEVFRDFTRELEIDKAKTEFVSLASHQLRTPLSAINWYAEMLLAGDVGRLGLKQQQYVEEVYRSNLRMIELVNALLSVSRIEMGTFVVEPKNIYVQKVIEQAIDDALPQFKNKKLHLKKTYDRSEPLIFADPKLLLVIFQNLISNAVKYTPNEGTIAITLWVDDKEKALKISIADTGYGIPAHQQDKIFTKLFRADNVRTVDTGGTGLGLYIVKSVIDHSGGQIWFKSKENQGTTFYISLPLAGMKSKVGTKVLQ